MYYKCLDCGHLFEEGEEARWTEYLGEFWGVPCRESMKGCPICKGAYERTVPCKNCLSEHLLDELDENGLCEDCREEE